MTRGRWHIHRDGDALIVARRWPVRWDLSVERVLPAVQSLSRLAHQIRQDLWRALQHVRGFQPAVAVTRGPDGCHIRAGGAVDGRLSPTLCDRIGDVLDDAACRTRWLRFARRMP